MSRKRCVIIGGGLAGFQAACVLRQRDAECEIDLVHAEPHLPYDRPPLTKLYLLGEKKQTDLCYAGPDFYRQARIRCVHDRAAALRPRDHQIDLAGGTTLGFDKALLASGGRPIRLDIPGAERNGVRYLRTLDQADAIRADLPSVHRVVVVGAGFIGMELAASLTGLGKHVTVVDSADRVWPRFLPEPLSQRLRSHFESRGVRFELGTAVAEVEGVGSVSAVRTAGGRRIPCDLVCVGVGIRPETALAQAAGIDVADGVIVDEYLRTSHPDVYAAGDVVNFPDPLFGRRRVEHWGHAEYTGQLAAANMLGAAMPYRFVSYAWSKVFDLHLEFAGDERESDDVIVRGNLDGLRFTLLCLKDRRLRAFFAVNQEPKEFPIMKRWMQRETDLTPHRQRLADSASDLSAIR